MTVICYKDANGDPRWDALAGSAETSLADWKAAHPGIEPAYQFMPQDTILIDNNDDGRMAFEAACDKYGLKPDDYGKCVLLPDGHRGIVKGFAPKRRKYVVRVWDCAKQSTILCTPAYVKHAMDRWRDKAEPASGVPANEYGNP